MKTPFIMPQLSYQFEDLAPAISAETMSFHWGKHLQGYINQLNALLASHAEFKDCSLYRLIQECPEGPLLNQAGQVLNHVAYFTQLKPFHEEAHLPTGSLLQAISENFGSFDSFREQMSGMAVSLFGSGWVWLQSDSTGKLDIQAYANAGNPVRSGLKPLFCIDVWEHAYYLDYQNRRADYVKAFWQLLDWDLIEKRMWTSEEIF